MAFVWSGYDWSEYLELSRRLRREADECSRRTAISRGYYAILGKARNCFPEDITDPTINPDSRQLGSHKYLWDTFKGMHFAKGNHYNVSAYFRMPQYDLSEIATKATKLQRLRVAADYRDRVPNLDAHINDAFELIDELWPRLTSVQANIAPDP